MASRRTIATTVVAGLALVACGTSDDANAPGASPSALPAPTHATTTASDSTDAATIVSGSSESDPIDGFRSVEGVGEIAGVWVPIEVGGETVDGSEIGAHLQIIATDERVQIQGSDGCNRVSGFPTGVRPAFEDGRFAGLEFGSTMQDCDVRVPVSPEPDGRLFVSADLDELLAIEVPFTGSILYQRVDSVPVDPREAIWEAEGAAEEAARQSEEAAEQAALAEAELTAREAIRSELPLALARWADAGVDSYTIRFEVGALMLDPSFPQRRPVGGVWEIEVVDGVAVDNDWADSVLGDTVEDWFAYVESQLDSHYLRVEFDPDLGFLRTIDSQPLDDVVTDPSELAAWIVFAELEPAV